MAQKTKIQIIQFSFIGIANALIDIGSLNVLLFLWPTEGASTLLIFNTISYTLAIINSYIWNSKYTFSHRANFNYKQIGLFTFQALIALLVSNLVFIGFYELLKDGFFIQVPKFINHNISKGVAMFLSSSTSYLLMRYLVFRKSKPAKDVKS
ncbi:GtrA family protein [Aquibacillus sp. 3ASR75-11]|uniref:GtrA family protein n=1 Tax=Terrihalobacillus insolitus TaxID=2950438 RepID=A0A9X4ALZ7_9BACI|nr:GtrA family protein [Terrihalobacillus insolitus]MDC3412327.1 GtrA family protein [Terrihalobacillus insolitus]MDC3422980.1 GtrA family protein [Terrihalobacillus insolitus]